MYSGTKGLPVKKLFSNNISKKGTANVGVGFKFLNCEIPKSYKKSLSSSGCSLFNQSNIILAKLYFISKGTIPLIGVGGVFSGEDAYKKICIGASIVQLYTAFAFKGPLVFSEILEDLNTLVKKDGYSHISEAVGSKNYQFLVDETDRSIFG